MQLRIMIESTRRTKSLERPFSYWYRHTISFELGVIVVNVGGPSFVCLRLTTLQLGSPHDLTSGFGTPSYT